LYIFVVILLFFSQFRSILFLFSYYFNIIQPFEMNLYMFGWVRNSRIAVVLEIRIIVVHLNTNLIFRNSENNYYYAISREGEITVVILNSPLLFQINNPNNIFIIQNSITFYYSHPNRKINIFSLI
jgi:hypothetical protein